MSNNIEQKAFEWLNQNQLSYDIWSKKYRFNNESFDQWLERVSGGNSKIKELIRKKKFLFGGRTLANRGTNNGSYSNCFTEDAVVRTKRGLVPIKDVVIGDYVLTDKNRYCRVNNTFSREYTGDLYKFSSHEIYAPIICTPNHQFLTNHGWKRADRIFPLGVVYSGKGGDKLRTAEDSNKIFQHAGEGEIIDFTAAISDTETKRLKRVGNKVCVEKYVNCSSVKGKPTYVWKEVGHYINQNAVFNSDFAYFVGRWLGDGSITRRKGCKNPSILQIVFNASSEQSSAQECIRIGEQVFGIKPSVSTTKQNVIAVRFENELISTWFLNTFGEKCSGKHVPDKYLGNYNMLLGLFDSDGFLGTHGRFKIVLKNYHLLDWARKTCYLNNINAGEIKDISSRQPDTYEMNISTTQSNGRLNKDMRKSFFDKEVCNRTLADYIVVPDIEILENQSTTVYNISVEEDHTYTVNGVVVHNCYSHGYIEDSLDGIMDAAKNIAMTFKAQGGQGLSLSKIRPKGSLIGGKFKSDGIVPFMEIFNTVTESVSQGGSRKGALMMSLDINHPEIETFMTIKSDLKKINKANLSVEIDDTFMQKVEAGDTEANRLFNILCEQACKYAEPGVIFTNRFRNYNLMEFVDDYQIETCNPCGL